MILHCTEIQLRSPSQGLYEFTSQVKKIVAESRVQDGVCNLFIRHTSASLCIQENADPTARSDLEQFFSRLVPENQPYFQHTLEGPDDMPSHIKSALTATSLNIPIRRGKLYLGTWQGIYLWEHRRRPSTRQIAITVWGT